MEMARRHLEPKRLKPAANYAQRKAGRRAADRGSILVAL
jgi:hypothetical protein